MISPIRLTQLPSSRPQPGEVVRSQAFPANVPEELISPVFNVARETQFMRCVTLAAVLSVQGEIGPEEFERDSHVETYKVHTGWLTPESADSATEDYWSKADELARYVGASMSHLFANPDIHDRRNPPAVALVMEHKRTHSDATAAPLENPFRPTFSGTTFFARNVAPDKFGAHLDLVHSSPIVIGFIARGGGTIVREGIYHALDPLSSQEALNATGNSLYARQLPDDELYYGDARTLMHEAPSSQDGWRDHIRFYVAPQYANET
jgi:hypothetical protein